MKVTEVCHNFCRQNKASGKICKSLIYMGTVLYFEEWGQPAKMLAFLSCLVGIIK